MANNCFGWCFVAVDVLVHIDVWYWVTLAVVVGVVADDADAVVEGRRQLVVIGATLVNIKFHCSAILPGQTQKNYTVITSCRWVRACVFMVVLIFFNKILYRTTATTTSNWTMCVVKISGSMEEKNGNYEEIKYL